jgi:hypothetical protein
MTHESTTLLFALLHAPVGAFGFWIGVRLDAHRRRVRP